ncbi:Hint domain-containing protein [Methylobacterium ajmalii]|uniref:Hint domain-containing protein n=1 Tax=Methylobacterium ajmalii TaxID=2738439 RepID=A0ABV0A630_9HYPH
MAIIDVKFEFNNAIAGGTITLDDQTGIISNISGFIDGTAITGLSNYRNPDNLLYREPLFRDRGTLYSDWSTTPKGVSFTTAYHQYNLSGTGNGFGVSGQPGDTLYSTTTEQPRIVNFYTDTYAEQIPICFTTGTLIRTDRGEVAVEDLCAGDQAATASGSLRAITWIGHRRLGTGARALPHDQQPIRVRAGAFGPGVPTRDLCLSPGHPVLVGADADSEGGHLVPIMCLINGTTIVREPATSVTYWHVELDSHDILIAEGLAAESYLDWGDRRFFTEASDHALHNPDFVVPGLSARCRPVAVDGPVVEAERARLSAVFAAALSAQCGWDAVDNFSAMDVRT